MQEDAGRCRQVSQDGKGIENEKGAEAPFSYLPNRGGFNRPIFGAGNEARTRDLNLGKVALYQLSYSRITRTD